MMLSTHTVPSHEIHTLKKQKQEAWEPINLGFVMGPSTWAGAGWVWKGSLGLAEEGRISAAGHSSEVRVPLWSPVFSLVEQGALSSPPGPSHWHSQKGNGAAPPLHTGSIPLV